MAFGNSESMSMTSEVREFLRSLPPASRGVVSALRAVVRRAVPDVEESVLWGGLSYHRPSVGGRVKGAVCLIGVKQGKVRLDFIHGVRLADPMRILKGQKRKKPSGICRPAFAAQLHQADFKFSSQDGLLVWQ